MDVIRIYTADAVHEGSAYAYEGPNLILTQGASTLSIERSTLKEIHIEEVPDVP